jgi:hypothetical protein
MYSGARSLINSKKQEVVLAQSPETWTSGFCQDMANAMRDKHGPAVSITWFRRINQILNYELQLNRGQPQEHPFTSVVLEQLELEAAQELGYQLR